MTIVFNNVIFNRYLKTKYIQGKGDYFPESQILNIYTQLFLVLNIFMKGKFLS